MTVETFPGSAALDYAGVVPRGFAAGVVGNGALRWRGSTSIQWMKGPLTLGWQSRYMSGYYLEADRQNVKDQGGPRVSGQLYHDVSLSYRFDFGAALRAGINNVFNTWPPFDARANPLYYNSYADPRLRNFYLGLSKSF